MRGKWGGSYREVGKRIRVHQGQVEVIGATPHQLRDAFNPAEEYLLGMQSVHGTRVQLGLWVDLTEWSDHKCLQRS